MHPDIVKIEKALVQFRQVTDHINKMKKQTELQQQIFDVFYQVENCPPTLLSAAR